MDALEDSNGHLIVIKRDQLLLMYLPHLPLDSHDHTRAVRMQCPY